MVLETKTESRASPSVERRPKKSYNKVISLTKTKEQDRSRKLAEEEITAYKEQRRLIHEYARTQTSLASEISVPENDEGDGLDCEDPARQWSLVDSLDDLAHRCGLDTETLEKLRQQQIAQTTGGAIANGSSSSERPPASIPNIPADLTQDTLQSWISNLPDLPAEVRESLIKTATQCITMANDLVAQKKQLREKADEEAKKRRDIAMQNLQATKSENTASTNEVAATFEADDYHNSYYSSMPEDLDLSQPLEVERLYNRVDRLETATQATLRATQDARGREMPKLLLFLPRGMHPQQLQWECRQMDKLGYLNIPGFVGMSERGTPIHFYLRSEEAFGEVADVIYYWNPNWRTALDAPTQNGMQLDQARDALSAIISKHKEAVGAENAGNKRFHLQWPQRRQQHKNGTVHPEADWWSIFYKDGVTDVVIMRCEYKHDTLTQGFIANIAELKKLKLSGAGFKDLINNHVEQMYEHQVQFTNNAIPMLDRAPTYIAPVKAEAADEQAF